MTCDLNRLLSKCSLKKTGTNEAKRNLLRKELERQRNKNVEANDNESVVSKNSDEQIVSNDTEPHTM